MKRIELGYLPILAFDPNRRTYDIAEIAKVTLDDYTVLDRVFVVGTRNHETWHLVYSESSSRDGNIEEEKLKSVSLDRVVGYNPNVSTDAPCGN
ncbi:MAG TPA: hypothetical protein VHA12_03950 [Candidatus Nanoarchaeia archaeon]|nr:hypothetical protein [Candidatus Nanoarchaeia archaeon]